MEQNAVSHPTDVSYRNYYETYRASLYAALYDTVEIFKRKYIIRLLQNKLNQHTKILDIGAGSGIMGEATMNPNNYFCMDIAFKRIKLHSYYTKMKGYSNLSIQGDACILPIKNKSFDAVFCIETLEHIKYDREVLKEINHILNTTGKLLLTVPYDEKPAKELSEKNSHINTYNENIIKKLASESGFSIEKIVFISKIVYLCWTLPKHIIYFLWLSLTGRLIKRLRGMEIPSYYNTIIHRKFILPVSMFVLRFANSLGLAYTTTPYTFCGKAPGMIVLLKKQ
ncbi:MAG: class I SAM-dependent methyltransferase [bacterium]|nr:class I SAM-dependent methyltransferase [bacterium]